MSRSGSVRAHILTAHLIKKKTCLRDKVEKGYSRQEEQYVKKNKKTKPKQKNNSAMERVEGALCWRLGTKGEED